MEGCPIKEFTRAAAMQAMQTLRANHSQHCIRLSTERKKNHSRNGQVFPPCRAHGNFLGLVIHFPHVTLFHLNPKKVVARSWTRHCVDDTEIIANSSSNDPRWRSTLATKVQQLSSYSSTNDMVHFRDMVPAITFTAYVAPSSSGRD